MLDLDTIHFRNQKAADKAVREAQVKIRMLPHNPKRLVEVLASGLEIDLKVGRYESVMAVCERMMDIAFECATKAIEGITAKEEKSGLEKG